MQLLCPLRRSCFVTVVRAVWSRSRSESSTITLITPSHALDVVLDVAVDPPAPPAMRITAGGAGPPSPDLAAVLVAVGSKDPVAFRVLYEECARRIYGVVRKTISNPDSCAEVTQEVFLMVWEQGDRYRPELGHPVSWLMTLAHRRAVDRVRSDSSRRLRDEKWGRRNCSIGFDDVTETVLGRDEAANVRSVMSVLSPLQRQSISLAYFSHLTYNEVADHLGIPASTVKTRIRDGLKKLRAALEAQREGYLH